MPNEKKEKVHAIITAVMTGIGAMALTALLYFTLVRILFNGSMRTPRPEPVVEQILDGMVWFIPLTGITAMCLSLSYLLSKHRERHVLIRIDPSAVPEVKKGNEENW